MRRVALVAVVGAALGPRAAVAEPHGAVIVGSELALSGGGPTPRAQAAAIAYLGRRHGAYASVERVALDGDRGLATVGVAYRAAAARPRLELVLHADLGVAWPRAAAAGGGVLAFLWPTRLPVALVGGVRAHALIDEPTEARIAWSLCLGLALAR